MEYKVETSLWDFPAWSGGKDTLDVLKERGDCDEVEGYLDEIFSDSDTTDTNINDYLWFERDAIAEHLGYRDWEAYEEGWSLEDLEEADAWFNDEDFDRLGDIAGISRGEYEDDEEGFCDAINDWWNELDDEKKVDIYYKNN